MIYLFYLQFINNIHNSITIKFTQFYSGAIRSLKVQNTILSTINLVHTEILYSTVLQL